ncbi:sulfite exporter TauE/SafE family protein [Calothrix rhizosoleniae]|uniref:sulfite exporter TauE/SafE family protein n=1 Tax=Calothrix rhizosoleniae TaxID=888997 RepID=UPI001F2CAD0C|nr:sulfite exporter TauE/SafE family protein [Calothrix rhizosoleniae]
MVYSLPEITLKLGFELRQIFVTASTLPMSLPKMSKHSWQNHRRIAFLYAVPIGLLGGLMGLGGAEFRLPVLVGSLKYSAREAIYLNLAVSLVTIAAAIPIRGTTLSFTPVIPFLPAVLSLIVGAVITAFVGTAIAHRLSNRQLEQIILYLLVIIGTTLIIEGFLPTEITALLPNILGLWLIAGVGFGLLIGLVSSLLGVAGGEIIIPTLIFAFGADVKTAGTSALLISLPTVLVGVLRYASKGVFRIPVAAPLDYSHPLKNTVLPMGIGSAIGALLGGLMVGVVPGQILKVVLGIILIISAVRVFFHQKRSSH